MLNEKTYLCKEKMDHESCINKLGIHSQQNIRYKTVSGIYFTNFIEIMHSAYENRIPIRK